MSNVDAKLVNVLDLLNEADCKLSNYIQNNNDKVDVEVIRFEKQLWHLLETLEDKIDYSYE